MANTPRHTHTHTLLFLSICFFPLCLFVSSLLYISSLQVTFPEPAVRICCAFLDEESSLRSNVKNVFVFFSILGGFVCACERVLMWMCVCVDESVFVSRCRTRCNITENICLQCAEERTGYAKLCTWQGYGECVCLCACVCVREMNFYCFINLLLGTGLRTMSVCIVSLLPSHAYSNYCRQCDQNHRLSLVTVTYKSWLS